jgi:DNA-binding MarR family transcriptional regulator
VEPCAGIEVDAIASTLEASSTLIFRHLIDRAEISITAAEVLHRLQTDGPTRLTALATAVGVSQPAMTQVVQRLERQSLVARDADPTDRRATLVVLTGVGLEFVQRRHRGIRARLAAKLAELTADERNALELASRVALPIIEELITGSADDEQAASPRVPPAA